MKMFAATLALLLVAVVAEASYLPYGGGYVANYATASFPVASVAYPSYGLYGKSVLPLAAKYSFPAAYGGYPLASKVVTYGAAPAAVYGGAKIGGYGYYGYGGKYYL